MNKKQKERRRRTFKSACAAHGIPAHTVAKRLGISASYLSFMVSGKLPMRADCAECIERFIGVPVGTWS